MQSFSSIPHICSQTFRHWLWIFSLSFIYLVIKTVRSLLTENTRVSILTWPEIKTSGGFRLRLKKQWSCVRCSTGFLTLWPTARHSSAAWPPLLTVQSERRKRAVHTTPCSHCCPSGAPPHSLGGAVHPSWCSQTAVLTPHYADRLGKEETRQREQSAPAAAVTVWKAALCFQMEPSPFYLDQSFRRGLTLASLI